ncbi:MAG: VWA domain-containing protein [Elusimicrobia bacterium]|nr:VWA domain-containing protein [Elusimicrobiota bacterium]
MFQNSHYFSYFIFVGIFTAMFLIFYKLMRKDFKNFSDAEIFKDISNLSFKKHLLRGGFLILAFVCIVTALARPRWGFVEGERTVAASDIVIALDTSKSMLARDLRPDRITRARMVFYNLVRQLPGQRIGLIAFAGKAVWKCPLTHDHNAFLMFLNVLDTNSVPFYGTNIASAINLAVDSLRYSPQGSKALVLITDGEHLAGEDINQAVRNAQDIGLVIFTVGIGTIEGEPIPLYENGVFTGFARDADGSTVMTRLDEAALQRIARQTGGEYFNLNRTPNVAELLARRLNNLDMIEGRTGAFVNLQDRFYIPLALGIIFLMLFFFMPEVKNFKFLAAFIIIAAFSQSAFASPMFSGVSEYERGNFAQALEIFQAAHARNPQNPKINYNLATAYYRNNNFENAMRYFQQALQNTTDEVFQSVLLYNMGNTAFRMGNTQVAEQFYRASLNLNPSGFAAKHNLEFLNQQEEQGQNGEDNNNQDENESEAGADADNQNAQTDQGNELDPRTQNWLDHFNQQDQYHQNRPPDPARRPPTNFW